MAIQMRRGNLVDFEPSKMRAGEWAVSIDNDTSKQFVYMCFAPGIVKRMGTYEDLKDLIEPFSDSAKESAENAKISETNAKNSETHAKESETKAKTSEQNAKISELKSQEYMENAFNGTPEGYEKIVTEVSKIASKVDKTETLAMRIGDVGGKNLIPFPYCEKVINNRSGLTFTPQSDGGLKIQGESEATPVLYALCKDITLKKGTYRLLGLTQNTESSNYDVEVSGFFQYYDDTRLNLTPNKSFTLSSDTTFKYLHVRCIKQTYDTVVYPMLVKGTEAQPYERYVPSMAEIADKQINNDMWNSTTSYAVGDYVLYNNTLYRCIVACTNIAPPNRTYWVASNITSEFKSVNNSFNNLLKPSSFNSVQIYDDFGVLENGGYIQNGNLVHIHLKIKLSKSLTADTLYYFGQNVPSPVDCALITVYGAYKRIYGSGGFTTATSLNFTTNVDIPSGSTIYIDSTYYAQ